MVLPAVMRTMCVRVVGFFLLLSSFAHAEKLVLTVPLQTTLSSGDGQEIVDTTAAWVELIDSAKEEILLEHMYVSHEPSNPTSEPFQRVLEALKRATDRGVKLRLMVESNFNGTGPKWINLISKNKNTQVRYPHFADLKGIQHGKLMIVDGAKCTQGSANLDWRALAHIHELGVLMYSKEICSAYQRIFDEDWNAAESSDRDVTEARVMTDVLPQTSSEFEVVASPDARLPNGIASTRVRLMETIRSAKTSLYIQVMDYSTKDFKSGERWTELQDEIIAAAKRGVQVHMMVDQTKVKSVIDYDKLIGIGNIDIRFVSIPTWTQNDIPFEIPYARLIHSKYIIADGQVGWIGSENFLKNYFYGSRNFGLIIKNPTMLQNMLTIYDNLWASPYSRIYGGRAQRENSKFWSFDWDNNIANMPTKIVLFKVNSEIEGAEEIEVDTADFASIRLQLNRPGDDIKANPYANYKFSKTTEQNSFKKFLDGENGENFFLDDVVNMIDHIPEEIWQAKSFKKFIQALSTPESAKRTTIITARGHSKAYVIAGLKKLQTYLKEKKGITIYLPPEENIFCVSHGKANAAADPQDAKVEVMVDKILNRIEKGEFEAEQAFVTNSAGTGLQWMYSLGFSDDDYKNFTTMVQKLSAIIKASAQSGAPHPWPNVKILVYYTGTKVPGVQPHGLVLTPDGGTRPMRIEEIGSTDWLSQLPPVRIVGDSSCEGRARVSKDDQSY